MGWFWRYRTGGATLLWGGTKSVSELIDDLKRMNRFLSSLEN
jgi:hypothetical protein